MDSTKRRRRRKNSTSTPEKESSKIPSMEEREKAAKKASKTAAPINPLTGIERINSLPDHSEVMKRAPWSSVLQHYQMYTVEQLMAAQSDSGNTVVEVVSIRNLIHLIKDGPKAYKIWHMIQNRTEGKAVDRVEYSGRDGGPIETVEKKELDIKKMTKGDRKNLKELILALQGMPKKDVEGDGGS